MGVRMVGCRECEQLTSGDCGRHGSQVIPDTTNPSPADKLIVEVPYLEHVKTTRLLALGDAMRERCIIRLELSGGWKCRACFGNDETGHKPDCPVAAWDEERKG